MQNKLKLDSVKHLRTRSEYFTEDNIGSQVSEIQKMVKHLETYLLENPNTAGVSAIQFQIPMPIFAFKKKEGEEIKIINCINPGIVKLSKRQTWEIEECASFPGMQSYCARDVKIKVRYLTLTEKGLEPVERRLRARDARVFQHELDHLNGLTIFDRTAPKRVNWYPQFPRIYKVKSETYGWDFCTEGETSSMFFSGLKVTMKEIDRSPSKIVGIFYGEAEAPKEEKVIINPGGDDKDYKQTQSGLYIPK